MGERIHGISLLAGGNDALWQIFSSPPLDTSMIANPPSYSPESGPTINLPGLLDGIDAYFSEGKKDIANCPMPKTELFNLAFTSSTMRREIFKKLKSVQTLSISEGDTAIGEVNVYLLGDETFGSKLIDVFNDFEVKMNRLLRTNNRPFDHLMFDEYVTTRSGYAKQQKKQDKNGKETEIRVHFLHKELLVGISSHGYKNTLLSRETMEKIFSEIVDRYERT